ncbi:MAG: inositol polyphosphate 5-phosphatase [Vezdaea aestivalis]|nr:MAG: inositol polyphosphate 5-phosphatase [Vezdaea aestivalis]
MATRLLIRDYPHRAIAISTGSHVLVFRYTETGRNEARNGHSSVSTGAAAAEPKCMVEFVANDDTDLALYRNLSPQPIQGTLGLITINNDVFLCIVSGSSKVATVRPGETVQRIHSVEFYCLNRTDYDYTANDDAGQTHSDDTSLDGYEHGTDHRREPPVEHPCLALKKLLSGGTFYYSTDFDLTNRLQDRSPDASAFDIENVDDDFLWNSYMIGPLLKFRSRLGPAERTTLDSSQILTSVIRGFVLTINIPLASSPLRTTVSGLPSNLTLISRLSCRRAGTRFNARGIDDDGNVANFVESETIFWTPGGQCFSYCQIRGSVPIFWEQATNLLPGQQKITVSRSSEATQPAFDKHFDGLQTYGAIHIVNLLSQSKPGEAEITKRYQSHVRRSPLTTKNGSGNSDRSLLHETDYDFHAETKGPAGYEAASAIKNLIEGSVEGFAYYLLEDVDETLPVTSKGPKKIRRSIPVLQQEGVFRTNCLDCLDRTNLVQTNTSQMVLATFLSSRGEKGGPDFWMRHGSLWADNGDSLSKIYAGTGALKSSFTRHGKMSFAGALADVRKSAARMYINNFSDKGRQNTIDLLLGRLMGQIAVHLFDPISDYVSAEMKKRSKEYSSTKQISVWAGTLNLNGKTIGLKHDLSSWLCPKVNSAYQDPDIVVVGFQEIVELSPQHIMSTDHTVRKMWEKVVKRTLNENARENGKEEYVFLRGGQLVGAALAVYVKSSILGDIKNVEGNVKKTGMSGIAGNKGAVAIRMEYANTSFCFVTAHLAAGFANYEERNRDYWTISKGLHFQRNRSIEDHDTILWLGDFNYRIGLSDDNVRSLIRAGDIEKLYDNDQLNLQMVAGISFPHYSESRITFLPTYKYDLGTDWYDTSEKARIPAWCDRILRKGDNIRQIDYNTAPLKFSDHRPVYATFSCTISIVDEAVKMSLSNEIYEKRRNVVRGNTANTTQDDTDDEDLIGYESIAPGLPPASSDKRKWWLDNGQSAVAIVRPPSDRHIRNPRKPGNPFTPTNEPDWITIEKPDSPPPSTRTSGPPQPPPTRSTKGVPRSLEDSATSSRRFSRSKPPAPPSPSRRLSQSSQPATENRPQSLSSSVKSQAPPIPRKPVTLRSPSTENKSFPRVSTAPSPPPPRRSTPSSSKSTSGLTRAPVQTSFPPPPKKVNSGDAAKISKSQSGDRILLLDDSDDVGPPLPQRKATNTKALIDQDDGDENGDLSTWIPLRPR